MTWALHRLVLIVSTVFALVFAIPLAVVTRQSVLDRAISDAHRQTATMAAVLTLDADPKLLTVAVADSEAGRAGRVAVHLPGTDPIGVGHAGTNDVASVARDRRPATVESPGGISVLQPTVLDDGRTAVIEAFVADKEILRSVWPTWLAFGALAVILVAGSILLADRLGGRLVRATRQLSRSAQRLGAGDLGARITPSGPRELRDAAVAFNIMADDLRRLLDAERELAADLSHRLRTPLTALRLDAEAIPSGPLADRMRQACDLLEEELEAIINSARLGVDARGSERSDLAEVLADRLAFWSVLAEDQQRPWAVEGGDQPIVVSLADGDLIGVVDALLGNVFAHTPEGTAFRVTVSAAGLLVDDAGPGIADPAAAVRRGVSGAGSTGLGLDIVRRVAEAAGGHLEIGRGPLGGARIAFLLPTPDSPEVTAARTGRTAAWRKRPGRRPS
jgi:signal transduction histidine kinase